MADKGERDWWAFGEARYGQRKAIVEAEDWEGPAYQACVDAGNVCKKFESKRRRLDLSFQHHREVAALPRDEADALLDWAEAPVRNNGKPRSTRELRGEVSKRRNVIGAAPSLDTLRSPPGNRLDALKADRAGQFSIRVNDRWRVCFVWTEAGPNSVEIVDYH